MGLVARFGWSFGPGVGLSSKVPVVENTDR